MAYSAFSGVTHTRSIVIRHSLRTVPVLLLEDFEAWYETLRSSNGPKACLNVHDVLPSPFLVQLDVPVLRYRCPFAKKAAPEMRLGDN